MDNSQTNGRTVLSQIQNQSTRLSEGSQKKSDGVGCKKRPFPRANQSSNGKRVCLEQNRNQMNSDHTHSTRNQTSFSTSKNPVISNVTEIQTKSMSENQTKASGSNHPESKKHVSNGEPTNENVKHESCKLNKINMCLPS